MSKSPVQPTTPEKSSEELLYCRVCQKEFTKFDQRGFRNSGFSSHQNRCTGKSQNEPSVAAEPTVKKPRTLLPASISPSSSMPTADELLNTPNVAMDRSIIFYPCGVFQIIQCNYCSPESGLHNPSCHEIKDLVAVRDY